MDMSVYSLYARNRLKREFVLFWSHRACSHHDYCHVTFMRHFINIITVAIAFVVAIIITNKPATIITINSSKCPIISLTVTLVNVPQ